MASDIWPHMKPKVMIKIELSFDFFDLGVALLERDVSG